MKGYFASLAKQSGFRISKDNSGPRVSKAGAPGSISAPLDREETVMIPPPSASRRGENAPEPKMRQTVRSREKTASPVSEKPVVVDARKAVTGEKKTETARELRNFEPVKTETVLIEAPRSPRTEVELQPVAETRASTRGERVSEPVTDEKKLVEAEASAGSPPDPPDAANLAENTRADRAEQPKFFVKTAEIIEKGEAKPADIGGILFQEVREWVASGPAITDKPDPEAVEISTVKAVTQSSPEPGGVLVKERIELGRPGESPALEEQSFNLSIGTISVIIEDPERPPERVQIVQNERTQNASAEAKREFSRFGRNYL